MFFIIGLFLILPVLGMIIKANNPATKKGQKALLNALLLVISFSFTASAIITNIEPFNFHETIGLNDAGDYIICGAAVFIFSPFLWIVLYHFCRGLFRYIRVQKNAKMKKNKEYEYWRDDLNKIPPNIVMFTSIMETDVRKSLTATILKLKLTKYIEKVRNDFQCTGKDEEQLLESEKLALNLIRYGTIDFKQYSRLIEQEAIGFKYVKKSTKDAFWKIAKMLIALCTPVVMIITSVMFDNYVFVEYKIWVCVDSDVRYVEIKNPDVWTKYYYSEKMNHDDYYRRWSDILNDYSYHYNKIRADRFQYSIVWLFHALHISSALYLALCPVSVLVALFVVIEQLRYFKKNYKRTLQGNKLLNEAYALKNFLKDFTIIQERVHEEVVIYEYYLIYAVILDLNVKVENEIIDKYLNHRTM